MLRGDLVSTSETLLDLPCRLYAAGGEDDEHGAGVALLAPYGRGSRSPSRWGGTGTSFQAGAGSSSRRMD